MYGVSSVSSVSASRVNHSAYQGQLRIYENRHSEGPVQPVDPVTSVKKGNTQPPQLYDFQLPTIRKGADPVEMAVRSRIVPFEGSETAQLLSELGQAKGELSRADAAAVGDMAVVDGKTETEGANGVEGASPTECATCASRKYVDGSNDGSVSYQTPTHISPEDSATKVRSHEQEHVVNEQLYAEQDGREVVSQNVEIHSAICPDCGCSYTSGGLTTTQTRDKVESRKEQVTTEEPRVGEFVDVVA